MDVDFFDSDPRYYNCVSIGLDGVSIAQGTRGNLQFKPDSTSSDAENFRYVFTQLPFLRYILNTFFVAGTITVIALLFHSMAGYAFARLRFPGRETIFMAIFSTFLVSLQVIIVPLFILVQKMGMVNSYAGLII